FYISTLLSVFLCLFFSSLATPPFFLLSLHDALPISIFSVLTISSSLFSSLSPTPSISFTYYTSFNEEVNLLLILHNHSSKTFIFWRQLIIFNFYMHIYYKISYVVIIFYIYIIVMSYVIIS